MMPNDTAFILDTLKRDLPKNYAWPGNVRELEQAVRRILLTHHYTGDLKIAGPAAGRALADDIHAGTLMRANCCRVTAACSTNGRARWKKSRGAPDSTGAR